LTTWLQEHHPAPMESLVRQVGSLVKSIEASGSRGCAVQSKTHAWPLRQKSILTIPAAPLL
jgi:hypothetical protein